MLAVAQLGSQFGDATSVRKLQQTLRDVGKTNVSVTGTVDGQTAAAVYEVIRDNAARLKSLLPAQVMSAIDKLKSFDAQIKSYTNNQYNSTTLISHSADVINFVRYFSDSAADTIQKGLNEFFNAINTAAGALDVVIHVLTGAAVPDLVSVATTATHDRLITTFSKKLGKWRVAKASSTSSGFGIADDAGDCLFGDCGLGAAYTEIAPADKPPTGAQQVSEKDFETMTGTRPFYKKPLFWIAVSGGAVLVGGGGYLLLRHRRG